MKQLRTSDLASAAPVDGRGHRTPQTLLLIDERDALLREAAKFYPGASDRETARQIHTALSRYRDGRWRRDRATRQPSAITTTDFPRRGNWPGRAGHRGPP